MIDYSKIIQKENRKADIEEKIIILSKQELFKFIDERPAINKFKFSKACGISQSILGRRDASKRNSDVILKKEVLELYGYKE